MEFKEPTEKLLDLIHEEIVNGADVAIIVENLESACAAASTCYRPDTRAQRRYEAMALELAEALQVIASLQDIDELPV
jgi:hypothetical protein